MSAVQLLANFDRLAEAPGAVPRLRRFILDLAVRGKLVEQDAGDEPVTLLLAKIQNNKQTLRIAGKTKGEQDNQRVPAKDIWFSVPVGWSAVYLCAVANIVMGQSPPGSTYNRSREGVPLINGPVEFTPGPFGRTVTNQYTTAPTNFCDAGDMLVCVRGSTTGRTNVASFRACIGRGVAAVQPLYSDQFARLCLVSMRPTIIGLGRGIAFPSISKDQLARLVIPFPPLAEQHRIVAKVDELMALCDQLEAAQQERERCRDRLASASLQRLNQPAEANPATDQAEAAEARQQAQREQQKDYARFHLQNLHRLTTRPEHIKAMRQTILNLAVRGDLVRSVSSDGPAESLLTAIAKTKSQLAKTGSIRKTADLPPLPAEGAPFPLPRCWAWQRLGTVGYTQTGTTPPTSMPECFGGKTPFVTPSDLTASVTTYVGKGLTEIGVKHSRLIAKNSVLMVCIGSTIGKVNTVDRDICCNQQINTLTPVVDGMTGYIAIALRSDFFQRLVMANAGMGTLPILSKGKWEMLPVPLPPLAEQHRIVAKVDELMALCDQLEAQLTQSQTDSRRLLEAVLEAALAPA